MTVRRKPGSVDAFEDVLKQPDEKVYFTLKQIDEQIDGCRKRISDAEGDITMLEVRKAAALAL